MAKSSVLPVDLEKHLSSIGKRLESGKSVSGEISGVMEGLSGLPAIAISRAAPTIAYTAKLFRGRPKPSIFQALLRRRLTDLEQLLQHPELRYLFLFHLDGRMREAALLRISGGLPSPFLFAAVALRLNDWVREVRVAALACANRCFPMTPANVIADAALALLLRQDSWERWGLEREAIDAAFARADVAAHLATDLVRAQTGPASRLLRVALKQAAFDQHLERLSREAKQPSVRALAVQTIANKRARWPDGTEYKWIDKSMGLRTRVQKFAWRPISVPLPEASIVRAAASDKSAIVRKAAMDGIIQQCLNTSEAFELASQLKDDASLSVRERAHFILSQSVGTNGLPTSE